MYAWLLTYRILIVVSLTVAPVLLRAQSLRAIGPSERLHVDGPAPVAAVQPVWRGWAAGAELGLGVPEPLRALTEEIDGEAAIGAVSAERMGSLFGPVLYRAGVEGTFVRRRGTIGVRQLRARSARVGVEALLGVALPGRLALYGGTQIRNQKAFRDFDAREHDNLRWDLRLVPAYAISDRLRAEATLGYALSYEDDAKFVVDPRRYVRFGLTYLFKARQR